MKRAQQREESDPCDAFERLACAIADSVWIAHMAKLPSDTVRKMFLDILGDAERILEALRQSESKLHAK